jgi:adenine-specific DNA-methyltransferase
MAKYSNEELVGLLANDKNLDNDAKAQLIKILRENKTYGLVWEHNPEEAYELLRSKLPVFTEDKSKYISSEDPSAPNHILIEGDNLHAITNLVYCYEASIDVIYIDPPYNTGASNWRYNNDYVNKDDQYRHSKFMSFMNDRLCISKKLLSESGIIICAIDDYEVHNIRALMDEIYGENNRLGTICVVHNPRGRNDDTFIATMHEYLLLYAKNRDFATINDFPLSDEDIAAYKKEDSISKYNETSFIRTGNNSLRVERPGLWYEIYYNPEQDKLSLEKTSDNDILLLPINEKGEERCWRWGPETFLRDKDTELFVKKVKGAYKIYKKRRLTDEIGRRPRTVWTSSKYDASSNGIMVLQDIFGGKCPFPFPKSVYAVYDSLYITSKKDSLILDFFAGSGTTMHATMMLNKNDGGHRRCILVTNNENNICEEVTYERNKRVIQGYTTPKGVQVEGLKDNTLRYFRTELLDRALTHQNKKALFASLVDTLRIKENCFTEQSTFGSVSLEGKDRFLRYFAEGDRKLLVVFDSKIIPLLVKEIAAMHLEDNSLKLYIFSDGSYPYTAEFEPVLDKIDLVAMPNAIISALKYVLPSQTDAVVDENTLTPDELVAELQAATEAENHEQN